MNFRFYESCDNCTYADGHQCRNEKYLNQKAINYPCSCSEWTKKLNEEKNDRREEGEIKP